MTIKQTIKREETIEKEISLPYFCKITEGKDTTYFKVADEKTSIEAYIGISHNYYRTCKRSVSVDSNDISKAEEITEQEFNEAYHKALFEIGKYVPAPNTDYLDYVESKIEIGEVPLMMQEWKHLNQAIEQ